MVWNGVDGDEFLSCVRTSQFSRLCKSLSPLPAQAVCLGLPSDAAAVKTRPPPFCFSLRPCLTLVRALPPLVSRAQDAAGHGVAMVTGPSGAGKSQWYLDSALPAAEDSPVKLSRRRLLLVH